MSSNGSKFCFESTALEVVEGIDLRGKEIIVTGASAGIGVETARALAKAGARVVLGVRNLEKAEAVAKDIRKSTNNQNVEVEKLELGSLASVKEFVKRYLEKKRPLHILINNAGVWETVKSYTVDGFETTFGTNHVGHFALTLGLIPALIDGYKQSGKKSRVVNVSSLGHNITDIVYDDINFKNREFNSRVAYGQSKTANILFSVALNHLYSDKGIVSNALMPGIITLSLIIFYTFFVIFYFKLGGIITELARNITPEEFNAMVAKFKESNFKFKTVEQGASTTVWAAVAPELEGVGGKYLEDCQISKLSTPEAIATDHFGYLEYAVNLDNALKLWYLSIEWIKVN